MSWTCTRGCSFRSTRSTSEPRRKPGEGDGINEKKMKTQTLAEVTVFCCPPHHECWGSCSPCKPGLGTAVLLSWLEPEMASSWLWAPWCHRWAVSAERGQPSMQGSLVEEQGAVAAWCPPALHTQTCCPMTHGEAWPPFPSMFSFHWKGWIIKYLIQPKTLQHCFSKISTRVPTKCTPH